MICTTAYSSPIATARYINTLIERMTDAHYKVTTELQADGEHVTTVFRFFAPNEHHVLRYNPGTGRIESDFMGHTIAYQVQFDLSFEKFE